MLIEEDVAGLNRCSSLAAPRHNFSLTCFRVLLADKRGTMPSNLQRSYDQTKKSDEITNEVATLKSAFAVFDTDKSGSLSTEELVAVFTRPGKGCAPMSQDEARKLIGKFDNNGDGVLQIEEFIKAFTLGDKGTDGIADNEERTSMMRERVEGDDEIVNEKYNTVHTFEHVAARPPSPHPPLA